MSDDTPTADVVIVGSGPGGLVASLVLSASGLRPLVIEKAGMVGGTSATSGGGIWLPDNPVMLEEGIADSVEAGMTYLESLIGDQGPSTSRPRREAYIRGGARMVRFLKSLGVTLVMIKGFPDYFPDAPGGLAAGRMLNSPMFDARKLGPWQDKIIGRMVAAPPLVIEQVEDVVPLLLAFRSAKGFRAGVKVLLRTLSLRIRGHKPLTLGSALIGQLLHAALGRGVEVLLETSFRDLIVEEGRVVGVIAERGGREISIRAERGVILNAGGFAHNETLRKEYGPDPAPRWSFTTPADTGDALTAALRIGAATALMDEAYWMPASVTPDGSLISLMPFQSLPHAIIVDAVGARYMNESADYMTTGHRMYERNLTVGAIPSWLVMDRRHRNRYPLGSAMPRLTPRRWLTSGYMKKANDLPSLAAACGISRDGLVQTVERFNRMALAGTDGDFGRGDSLMDRHYGDPRVKPNPCLGPISEPPFYAVPVYPGDVGCAGGLLTDEHARVLSEDGTVLEGLYACGTSAASLMGDTYPGGGTSLGQSSVFGFVAAENVVANAGKGK